MHLLCCPYLKRNPPPTETDPDSPQPAESRSAPRRSRSIRPPPKPKASKQEIEKFYREGQELARHEREQRERTLLREALREEYQKEGEPSSSSGTPSEKNAPPESEESSLVEILPLDDTKPTPLSAIPEDNGVGYDSNR